jgi:hypothetical protein
MMPAPFWKILALVGLLTSMSCSSADQPGTIPWCHDTFGLGTVNVGAHFASCPEITNYEVTPVRLLPGETAQLSGTAKDIDSNSLAFSWSAASGTVGDPNSSVTTYRCDRDGIIELTFIASDGTCQDVIEAAVDCIH